MLEKPDDAGFKIEEEMPADREEGGSPETGSDETIGPTPPERAYRPKKKIPIVNRRGPSEVDKAIKMSRMANGHSSSVGRKLAEGSTGWGTITHIDRAKGFGFLIDQVGEQRFFHKSAVLDNGFSELTEQQAVEFQVHNDERGARALNVKPSTSPDHPSKRSAHSQQAAKPEKAPTWRSALSPFRSGTSTPSNSNSIRPKNRNRNG